MKTTISFKWIGFAPTCLFAFGKLAGFLTVSWLWILVPMCLVYKSVKKEN